MTPNPMPAVRKTKMDLNYGRLGFIARVIVIDPVPVSFRFVLGVEDYVIARLINGILC